MEAPTPQENTPTSPGSVNPNPAPQELPNETDSADFQAEPSLFESKDEDKTGESSIAENIVKLQTEEEPKKPILGEVPTLDESIIDQAFLQKKKLYFLYSVFGGLLLLFGLSFGFFYTQLAPDFTLFGANLTQQVESTNQEVYRVQTDINEINLLTRQILLNSFAFNGNKYQDYLGQLKQPDLSEEKKSTIQTQLSVLKQELTANLSDLQINFQRPVIAPIFHAPPITEEESRFEFEQKVRDKLRNSAVQYKDKPERQEEYSLFEGAAKLVGNKELNSMLANINIDKIQNSPTELNRIVERISEYAKNEFAIVNTLKARRVNWNEVVTDIINSTKQAEEGLIVANEGPYQMDLYESGGATAILYSNFTIDADTSRISISGTLKTPDEKTFSTMANLIESLRSSPKFTGVDYRAFAKSGTREKGFESNFKIEFGLQKKLFESADGKSGSVEAAEKIKTVTKN